jgi:hypothetical protein
MIRKTLITKIIFILAAVILLIACGPRTQPGEPTAALTPEPSLPHGEVTVSPEPPTPGVESPAPIEETPPPAADTPTPTEETPPATETPAPTEVTPGEAVLKVVFVRDQNAWLWTEGEGSRPLTEAGQVIEVQISSNGRMAAFIRQVDEFSQEIWSIETDGEPGSERLLLGPDDFNAMEMTTRSAQARGTLPANLQFIPGTHLLTFNIYQAFEGPGMAVHDDLRRLDTVSGELSDLVPVGQGGVAQFSPDGSTVALITPDKISLVNSDGANYREAVLRYEPVLTYSEYYFTPRLYWSPDGTYLKTAIPPREPLGQPLQPTTLWHIPVGGEAVNEGSVTAISLWDFGPHYSPDLTRILYVKEVGRPEENLRELHIANSDGSDDQVYHVFTAIQSHGWAGSNERFVFSQGEQRSFMLAQVGGEMQPLIEDPFDIVEVEWLDEHRFIYFKPISGNNWELTLRSLDGQVLMSEIASGFPLSYDITE